MSKKVFAFCAVLALALVASPAVMAQTEESVNQSPAELKGAELFLNQLPAEGLRAYIDPDTGEFTQPSAEETAALRAFVFQRFQLQTEMAPEYVSASGAIYSPMDPSLHSAATAHVSADGTLHFDCTDGSHTAPSEAPAREEM